MKNINTYIEIKDFLDFIIDEKDEFSIDFPMINEIYFRPVNNTFLECVMTTVTVYDEIDLHEIVDKSKYLFGGLPGSEIFSPLFKPK